MKQYSNTALLGSPACAGHAGWCSLSCRTDSSTPHCFENILLNLQVLESNLYCKVAL